MRCKRNKKDTPSKSKPKVEDQSLEGQSEKRDNSEEDSKNSEPVDHNDIKFGMEESKKSGTKADSDKKALSQSFYSQGNSEMDPQEDEADQKQKTEDQEEAEKELLLKMRWKVNFTTEYFNEENQVDENIQSEKEVHESKLKKERELGQKLWSLIGYIFFFGFFSYLAFSQIRVSMFNMYNDSLKDSIEGPLILSLDNVYSNITVLDEFVDLREWVVNGLPTILQEAEDPNDENVGLGYFFINDYNYVIEEKMRF